VVVSPGALRLGLLVFWLVWFLPKATITIMVLPKTLDQDVEITLSTTDSSINFSDKIVPAEVESVSESGQKMVETTGKKTVGDPAKGTVTIYNKTTSPKTFSKGTHCHREISNSPSIMTSPLLLHHQLQKE
jgi:hypothetical protein